MDAAAAPPSAPCGTDEVAAAAAAAAETEADEGDLAHADAFATTSKQMRNALRRVKRQEYGVHARLASIALDAAFVRSTTATFFAGLPLVGNLRNGAWYIDSPPRRYATFKSGDGHVGQEQFSQRRLNMDFLRLACAEQGGDRPSGLPAHCRGGAVLVDSTRQGKTFPDSMSCTVPVWCMVLNAVAFPEAASAPSLLPPWAPPGQADRVAAQVAAWAAALPAEAREVVRSVLRYPLRPVWVCAEPWDCHSSDDYAASERDPRIVFPPDLQFRDDDDDDGGGDDGDKLLRRRPSEVTPIVLLSASVLQRAESDREVRSWRYVQGAGDDEEFWSLGLTHELYWTKSESFTECKSNAETEALIRQTTLGAVRDNVGARPIGRLTDFGITIAWGEPGPTPAAATAASILVCGEGGDPASPQHDAAWTVLRLPREKGAGKTRAKWQAAIALACKEYREHGLQAALFVHEQTDLPAAMALTGALVLEHQIAQGASPDKAAVNRALFLVSEAVPTAPTVPRKLVKELVVHLFSRSKPLMTQSKTAPQ